MNEKKKNGRPTLYTEELAEYIFEKVREGGYLHHLCRTDPRFPKSVKNIYVWMDKHEGFRHKYAQAVQIRLENMTDQARCELIETEEKIKDSTYDPKIASAIAQMSKTKADYDRWMIGRSTLVKFSPASAGFKLDTSFSYEKQSSQITEALARGKLTAEHAKSLLEAIKVSSEIRKVADLEERIKELEKV